MATIRIGILLSACAAVALHAQAPPSFEVATVKPSGPESGPMALQRQPSGRLVTTNTPLTFLIGWAFDLKDGQLVNAPRGADSARFDIVAQPPSGPLPPGGLQMMLRALLVRRFGLVVHSEMRTGVSYVLTTDRDALRVGLTVPPEQPDPNPFSMTSAGVLRGRRVTTAMLAQALSSQLGAPVENGTRITGSFDFTLEWQPAGAPAGDLARPSLFTAIREQLGLRLDVRRTPIEVVVVDRLDLLPAAD